LGYKLFEDYLKICKSDKRKEADLPKIYAIEKSYEKIKQLSDDNRQLIKELEQDVKITVYLEKMLNDLEVKK